MKVEVADTFPPELDAVALGSPRATFYHTHAWLESLGEGYPRLSRRCLIAHEGPHARAFLPYSAARRGPFVSLWSLPFGTYGGPVGDDGACAELLRAFDRESRKRPVVEAGIVDFDNAFEWNAGAAETMVTHVVDI